MKALPSTPKPHVMTFVLRGDPQRLIALRQELHIAAIRKQVTLSALLISILMTYVADTAAHTEEAVS